MIENFKERYPNCKGYIATYYGIYNSEGKKIYNAKNIASYGRYYNFTEEQCIDMIAFCIARKMSKINKMDNFMLENALENALKRSTITDLLSLDKQIEASLAVIEK